MLWDAERPSVTPVAGYRRQCPAERKEFAELIDAPVVRTLMGLGRFRRSPNFISTSARTAATRPIWNVRRDVIIAQGAIRRPRDRPSGCFAPHARSSTDIDPAEIGKN
jgi:thiamine pyrophosphate-dependent acetolactate synthase large subunit-like protein